MRIIKKPPFFGRAESVPTTNFMKIGIVDADLIGRKNHRFPNLVCEKLSGYWKEKGAETSLLLHYDCFDQFDQVFVSKVFTDTPVPEWLEESDRIHIGGTGFYFDKAPNLPDDIEHHMPDYHLYDEWIQSEKKHAAEARALEGRPFKESSFLTKFKEYTDYSIGFVTRGCFRKCPFCVNQKFDHVFQHSPLSEFYDPSRRKICLLDDNFFGFAKWERILKELIGTGRPFKFKQGLDERLLTDRKCEMLFSSNYDGDFTFAFDNIADYDLIHKKLRMIRRHTQTINIKFYVLCGFEGTGAEDIANTFRRIALLMKYRCLPYVMRYQNRNDTPWKRSPFRTMYVSLARWCNQPNIFKKMSFRDFCEANQALHKTSGTLCASMAALRQFEAEYPEIARAYFDLRYDKNGKAS